VDIWILCDPSADVLTFVNFIDTTPQEPPPPVYQYTLMLSSKTLCGTACSLPGFNFNQIGSMNNYTFDWYPPGSSTPQTLSYAPCSSGTSKGCGSKGLPENQCTDLPNCCAVCNNWREAGNTYGACLGLSSNLMNISQVSSNTVKITYGGGDVVFGVTPRQVDILISCDPTADLLTYVDYIQPYPLNPPPPYYLYTLVLTSSSLCRPVNQQSDLMEKLRLLGLI